MLKCPQSQKTEIMEIISLEIKNIASIEDARIDFSAPPLKDEPIFLICGETGAGKSTILDAICLALYNDAPRLASVQTERIPDDAARSAVSAGDNAGKTDATIGTTDTRQFLRKGTGEGWIRLVFSGADGVDYTALWRVRRARGLADGRLQKLERSLEWGDGCCLAGAREIDEKVQQVTGMSFDQYCRTSMLAQGEFSKFLKSSDTDKADILEKLTRTDIYSHIGAGIYQRMSLARNEYQKQLDRMNSIILMTDSEKDEAFQHIAEYEKELSRLQYESKGFEERLSCLQARKELAGKVDEMREKVAEAEKSADSDESGEDIRLCREWDDASEARSLYGRIIQQEKEIAGAGTEVVRRKDVYTGMYFDLVSKKAELAAMEEDRRKLAESLEKRSANEPLYEASAAVIDWLGTMKAARIEESGLQGELHRKNEEYSKVADSIEALTVSIKDLDLRRQSLSMEIAGLRKHTDEADKIRKTKEMNALSARINVIIDARHSIGELRKSFMDLSAESEAVSAYRARRVQAVKVLEERERVFSEADRSVRDIRESVDVMKDSMDSWAKMARAKLRPGDPCPVCGHKVEHLLSDVDFEQMLKPLYVKLDTAERVRTEAETMRNDAKAEAAALANNLSSAAARLKTAEERYDICKGDADRKCAASGISAETDPASLDEERKNAESQACALRKALEEIAERESAVSSLQLQSETLQKETEEKKTTLNGLNRKLADIRADISSLKTASENRREKYDEAEGKVSAYISAEGWKDRFNMSPDTFISALRDRSAAYMKDRKDLDTLLETISVRTRYAEAAGRYVTAVMENFPDWGQVSGDVDAVRNPSDWDSLVNEWTEMSVWASSARKSLDSMVSNLSETREELSKALTRCNVDWERLAVLCRYSAEDIRMKKADIESRRKELNDARSALSQRESDLAAADEKARAYGMGEYILPEKLDAAVNDFATAISGIKGKIGDINQNIGAVRLRLKQDEENAAKDTDARKELERLYREKEKWERLSEIFGDATGNKFKKIAQAFVLAELIRGANGYLRRLSPRYELESQRDSLAITIRDLGQGGAERSVNTLSGGETFLVSLSLALGLSSLTRNALGSGTLFIDEGFGTLSSDYLNVVMSALEHLHQTGGKRVGIISHVEALRDRIPVQIQVRRSGPSSSVVKVVSGQM